MCVCVLEVWVANVPFSGVWQVAGTDRSWKREQNSGNVGLATREKQRRNYVAKKEKEADRLELFNEALRKFRKNDIQAALIDFENVAAMEPAKYIGDNFARYTDVYPYAQYNAACCYSALDQLPAGLEALEGALAAGFDDYDKVRSDPNLANLRKDEGFNALVNKVTISNVLCQLLWWLLINLLIPTQLMYGRSQCWTWPHFLKSKIVGSYHPTTEMIFFPCAITPIHL